MSKVLPVYDFNNWDSFEKQIRREHKRLYAKDGNKRTQVKLFRQYMSKDVTAYLGCLLNIYPGDKERKWSEKWINDIAKALAPRDPTLTDIIWKRTVDDCIKHYKAGKVSAQQLWEAMTMLAVKGDINHDELQATFWEEISPEIQQKLWKKCRYFDPKDEYWKTYDMNTEGDATMTMTRVMMFDPPEGLDQVPTKEESVVELSKDELVECSNGEDQSQKDRKGK